RRATSDTVWQRKDGDRHEPAGRGSRGGGGEAGRDARTDRRSIKNRRIEDLMEKFLIQGGRRLEGEIAVSGAKNSALPVLAACLLTADRVTLARIPPVRDIATMQKLIAYTGAKVTQDDGFVSIEAAKIK